MIICRSEGDFCLSFSSFSSCLISLFWTRLHFLISAYTENERHFLGMPGGPGPTLHTLRCIQLTRVCFI